jgi:hypothetical protein
MLILFTLFFNAFEPLRLRLGFFGNLRENLSDISGFLLFSLSQLPISMYFLLAQPFTGGGFTLPLEIALHVLYLIMLIPQIAFGFLNARKLVDKNNLYFDQQKSHLKSQ